MPSKTSFLNKAILKNIFRRFYWMGALYFIALLFAYPLNILMNLPTETKPNFTGGYIFRFGSNPISDVIIFVIPVLFAAFLFYYLQGRQSSDMIHSLPIKRSNLYNNHVFMGTMFLVLPVIAVALISWILTGIFNLGEFISTTTILRWTGTTLLMNMTLFLSTVFAGVVTGISIAQVILTYIVLFLPAGFIYLISTSLEVFLSGFSSEFFQNDYYASISPLVRIASLNSRPLPWSEAFAYGVFCTILFFLGRYLYNKRKLEKNQQVIVFTPLYQLFKYGVTFSFMLLGGVYFYSSRGTSISWLILGYGLASLIGFWIAEGILQKSVRIFTKKAFKCYLGYLVVMTLIIIGLFFDIGGYETRVPKVDDIQGVYFDYGSYRYTSSKGNHKDSLYVTPENIEAVQQLHQEILADGDHDKYQNVYNHTDLENKRKVYFVYHLKNGLRMSRSYMIDYKKYHDYLKPIHESLEDKNIKYDVLKIDNTKTKKLVINPNNAPFGRSLEIINPDEIHEAVEILKQEYVDASYETLTDPRVPWANINIMLDEPIHPDDFYGYDEYKRDYYDIYTSWSKNFTQFEAWLETKGYLEQARVMPEEISYIVVEKIESREEMDVVERRDPRTTNAPKYGNVIERFESNKLEDIEISLENYGYTYSNTYPKYIVGFYNSKKKQIFMGSFAEGYIPQFVLDHFEK
ncbi:hypothetical protein [Alkaliphilus hydrothermalis]|uniref:ABC-2 type transport system permease protein n=1 Tax=Alkaliphilus hydrothermalis TaxID=1482730 RepID=A0ABS2NLN0_9FIRM|nr:hypothetical protein [Alkaliphilus hydrothermalis]MBM7613833.1 ABC-2 type transport system permease protein [Alkaliphilus hydrothermalis]